MDLKEQLDLEKIPRHIAIIMDGNGRWAKKHGRPRIFGHRSGVRAVRETTETAARLGVKYLTLYAFSTENWSRPRVEVNALMALLVDTIGNELETLNKNKIKLEAIGNLSHLPKKTHQALLRGIQQTKDHDQMTLILALSYSGRWDIVEAIKKMSSQVAKGQLLPEEITDQTLSSFLSTSNYPDPELLIRTSGEYRISNFLLWQIAYSELYFSSVFWPDFREEQLYEAIRDYQHRERRFGKISEQLG